MAKHWDCLKDRVPASRQGNRILIGDLGLGHRTDLRKAGTRPQSREHAPTEASRPSASRPVGVKSGLLPLSWPWTSAWCHPAHRRPNPRGGPASGPLRSWSRTWLREFLSVIPMGLRSPGRLYSCRWAMHLVREGVDWPACFVTEFGVPLLHS